MSRRPRIAVVHEWVAAYAGSEQVFEAIANTFPDADLYALSVEPGVNLSVGDRPIRTTFLNRDALRERRHLTLPVMPLAWRRLGADKFDLVISSHHAFAHTNRLASSGVHLCYVHTPARYVWSPEIDGRASMPIARPAVEVLKRVDKAASVRVQAYAANSHAVAERIKRFWGRDAEVVPPPVRVEFFADRQPATDEQPYVLGVGRWIPYKGMHKVIEAADAAGLAVKIAGRGPDRARIERAADAARVPVEIVEAPSDTRLRELYQNAMCLVFPTVEDFGIVPVEAQAAGTPVVAPAAGGTLETVLDGQTGCLVDDLDTATLAKAIIRSQDLQPSDCTAHAQIFSLSSFQTRIREFVDRNGPR